MKTVAIIGGGASGLACAVELRKLAAEVGSAVDVVIFEATDKVGRSILASGNGRCNFSNANVRPSEYWNAGFAGEALDAFESWMPCHEHARHRTENRDLGNHDHGPRDGDSHRRKAPNGVVAFFEQLGLLWREEHGGRLYPLANKASVVLDVLRQPLIAPTAPEMSVSIESGSRISSIDPPSSTGGRFTMRLHDGALRRADLVVVACGGHVLADILPADVSYREMHPVLCPLATFGNRTKRMDNIRVRCRASLLREGACIASERGEVMFRKYGLSGIAVFDLSRSAEEGDVVSLDLMPDMDDGELFDILSGRASELAAIYGSELTNELFMTGIEPAPVNEVLLTDCGLDAQRAFNPASLPAIARVLKGFEFEVAGIADPSHAQCHRGGFAVEDFDARTMQSNDIDGLYVTGEALDVDGPCGGYNLHWAFATGILAARDIAARLESRS